MESGNVEAYALALGPKILIRYRFQLHKTLEHWQVTMTIGFVPSILLVGCSAVAFAQGGYQALCGFLIYVSYIFTGLANSLKSQPNTNTVRRAQENRLKQENMKNENPTMFIPFTC